MKEAIQFLTRPEIDIAKWDRCIREAPNGLIYGFSFYLDNMARHWDALVLGDYECVMPLTWNKKYGIHYLYQPSYMASLGIFGEEINDKKIILFIRSIPVKFRLIEIDLNHGNCLIIPPDDFHIRNNYILDLNKPYGEIILHYRDNIKRNCKKAQQVNCRYVENVEIEDVIQLSRLQMGKISKQAEEDFGRFKNLFLLLQQKGQAVACGVYTEGHELVASCVYFFSNNRAYYILVGNHPKGKSIGASHYLIDRFIFEHAEKNLLLDFEGSDIRNLAFFYSSFGATVEPYPALRINRLPWWANVLKNAKARKQNPK